MARTPLQENFGEYTTPVEGEGVESTLRFARATHGA